MKNFAKMVFGATLTIGLTAALPAQAQHTEHGSHGGHQHSHEKARASVGQPGNAKEVSRTVSVDMNDTMRFNPESIAVKQGEVVRFVVTNSGKLKHELVIGTLSELKEHAEMMRKFPGMEHDEPNQVAVEPGKSGVLIWRFEQAGKVDFACLQPGHFEAGMKGSILVSAK